MKSKSNDKDKQDRIKEILSDEKQITETLRRAVRDAVLAHKRAGNPIAVWKDGKAVLVETKQNDEKI